MKRHWLQSGILFAAVLALSVLPAACGGKLEGTYTNTSGGVMLELRSGGKAQFTLNGESQNCTWKANDTKLVLTCNGDSVDFGIHDDGSITGPMFIGVMRKSK
jgi:hypothetical protein